MVDPNVESAGQGAGAEIAKSPVSTPDQPSIEGNVASLITALESKFSEKFDGVVKEVRGLQSRQDKSDNNFQQQLARLEQFTSKGMTKDEALSAMQREDNESQKWVTLEKKVDNLASLITSGGTQVTAQQKTAETFAKLGLDTQDPRVAPFLAKQYENADAVELAAYRLKNEISNSPNPSPAQSSSIQGKSVLTDESAMISKLTELQKSPVQNRKEIEEIKKQLGW